MFAKWASKAHRMRKQTPFVMNTVKPVISGHSKRRPEIDFQDRFFHNAGQKYCRMLQREHSAILSTFIKLPFVIKIFVLSIFECLFFYRFTVFIWSTGLTLILPKYFVLKMLSAYYVCTLYSNALQTSFINFESKHYEPRSDFSLSSLILVDIVCNIGFQNTSLDEKQTTLIVNGRKKINLLCFEHF